MPIISQIWNKLRNKIAESTVIMMFVIQKIAKVAYTKNTLENTYFVTELTLDYKDDARFSMTPSDINMPLACPKFHKSYE